MGKTQQLGMYPNIGISSSGTPTTNYLPKFTGASTIGNSLVYDDGSTIGIGLSSLGAWDSTIRAMEIGTKGNFYGGFNGGASVVYIGTNAYYNGGWKYANTSAYKPQLLDAGGGNWHFQNAATGTAGNAITWTTLMKISDNGNVGIGTSSPTAWNGNQGLLVSQTGTGNTNTIYSLQSGATSVDTGSILEGFSTNTTSGSKALGSIVFLRENTSTTALSSYTAFYTNNAGTVAERMRITSGGAINIKDGTLTGGGGFEFTSEAFFGARFQSNAYKFMAGNNSTEYMRITSGGDVGIGGSISNQRLYVKAATSNGTTNAFLIHNSNGSDLLFVRSDGYINTGTAAASPYNNTYGNAANAFIQNDGSFGRSTSSLKYKENILDYTKGLAEVMQLRPVSYTSKNPREEGQTFAGLIAEEVHDLGLTEFVQYADDGTPDALAYQNMIALLTKAIQELSAKVTALENR